MRTFLACVFVFVCSLLLSTNTEAQINRANLNGTVTDPSGGSVPNAKVVVVAADTGFTRQVITGESGVYSITSLPTGQYDLTVSHEGFKSFEEKGIRLSVGETRTVNAQLQIGASTALVNVEASAQSLETNNAEIATVILSEQVSGIPINGRDWATLMTLAPGAVNIGGGGQRGPRFLRGTEEQTTEIPSPSELAWRL